MPGYTDQSRKYLRLAVVNYQRAGDCDSPEAWRDACLEDRGVNLIRDRSCHEYSYRQSTAPAHD
jgi:hypothetical protein